MTEILKLKFGALFPGKGEVVENGELTICQGKIQEISSPPIDVRCAEVVNWSDCFVMPGFVNAHCHLSLSALAGKVPRLERFTDWVRSLLAENEKVSWPERVAALHAGSREMVRSGVTTVADYMSQPELIGEFAVLPFRQILFLETLGFKPGAAKKTVKQVKSVLESSNVKGKKLMFGLAPHAPYSVSADLFRELRALADSFGCPFSSHVAEFPEEVRFLKEGGGELKAFLKERGVYDDAWNPPGKSPVRFLESVGVLESMIAVHLNQIDGDLDLLASRRVGAVFCPGSTRWFGRRQWMPVRQLLDRGVSVGLGTDSRASNESLNFLRELRIAEKMLPEVSRVEILGMATSGGAQALGMEVGQAAPGKPADLIGFRLQKPPDSWVDVPFDPNRFNVDRMMINGEIVLPESS